LKIKIYVFLNSLGFKPQAIEKCFTISLSIHYEDVIISEARELPCHPERSEGTPRLLKNLYL